MKKRKEHKIGRGLKEAIVRARKNGKEPPMVFEHVPVEKTPYERISDRVMAAVSEMNNSLKEAHECAEMRVFMGVTAKSAAGPMLFNPQIYRLTHSTMTFSVKIANPEDEPKMSWQAVKNPSFQDAAGQGLDALRKKAA